MLRLLLWHSCYHPARSQLARGGAEQVTVKVLPNPITQGNGHNHILSSISLTVNNATTDTTSMTLVEGSGHQIIFVPASGQYPYSPSADMTGLTVNSQNVTYNVQTTVLLANSHYVKIIWYESIDAGGNVIVTLQASGLN